MYLTKIDNVLVHGKGNRIVIDPVLTLSDNSAGNLTFKINTDQKSYDLVKNLKPVVSVESDEKVLWKGRIVDGSDDWYNMRTVNADGILTYLNDSVLRPFDVDDPLPFPAWFSRIIEEHNQQVDDYKKFKVGKVTIETKETEDDWDREITDYQTTMSVLDGFLNKYGGHIVVRYEADGNYIDYLNEYSGSEFENSQPISFGKNLINIDKTYKAGGVVTRLIPLGENGLTIEDVNSGKDFIDDIEAQGKYGIITQTHNFEGIDEDDALLTEARSYLEKVNKPLVTIEAKAIDLSIVDKDLETFKIGDQVKVISIPHSIDGYLQLNSIRLDMTNPDKSEFVFGNPIESLSKKIASLSKKRQFYTWTAYADDENGSGISLSPLNKAYLGIAENQPAKEVSIKNPKVFKWAKIKGEDGKIPPEELGKIDDAVDTANAAQNAAETAVTEANNAKKIATNYISSDTTGLMVAELEETPQTPSTVSDGVKNVKIGNDSVDIRNGKNVLASFGESIVLGSSSKMRSIFSNNKIEMLDCYDNKVFNTVGFEANRSVVEYYSHQDHPLFNKVSPEEIIGFLRDEHELQIETLYNAKNIESIFIMFTASGEQDFSDKVNWSIDTNNSKLIKLQRNELSLLPLAQFYYLKIIYKTEKSGSSVELGAYLANPQKYMLCVGGNGTADVPRNALTVDYYGNTNCESIFVKNDIKLFYDANDFVSIDSITCNGFITSDKTELLFTIPLTKPFVSDIKKIQFHHLRIKVRQNGKYLIGTGSASKNVMTFSDYEVTATPSEQGIRMKIKTKLYPLTSAMNNETLAVWIEDASAVCVEA